MKLKKIASLMLAGIMAVSMLAGCKTADNGNGGASSSEPTTTSNFTDAVMAEASKATNDNLAVDSDDTLDKAIDWAAANNKYDTQKLDMTRLDKSSRLVIDANTVIDDMDNYDNVGVDEWNFADANTMKDRTMWVMYIVDNSRSDEWIAKEIAGYLDQVSDDMVQDNCEYSIRVAKADVETNKDFGGSVVVGVMITIDDTTNNH